MKYSNRLFGLNLRRLRDAAGKKQKDIAKIFDSDPVTVSRWETGAMGIDKDKIPKLCEFFGVNESEFYKDLNAAQTLSELASIGPKKLGDMTPDEFESWDAKRRQKLSQIEPIPITQKINHGTIENLKLQIETLTREYNEQKRQIKKLEKQLPTKKQRDLLGRIESAQPIRQKIIEAVIYNNPTLIRSMSPDVIQAFQLLSKAR